MLIPQALLNREITLEYSDGVQVNAVIESVSEQAEYIVRTPTSRIYDITSEFVFEVGENFVRLMHYHSIFGPNYDYYD